MMGASGARATNAGLASGGVLCALLLSACASLPPNTPPREAKTAAAYAATTAFAAPAGDWPGDGWWKRYGDAQLDDLMNEALAGAPTLAEARARVAGARAARAVAAAQALPVVGASGSVEEQKQSYNDLIPSSFLPKGYQDYGQWTLNLNWELDFWGKVRAAVAAATSEARAADADAAEARLVLTTDIASEYADLARLYAEREVALEAVKVREETASLAAQRVANGLDTQAELLQAQAGPPAARAVVAGLDEQIDQTRNALAALVGAGPDRGLTLTPPTAAHLAAYGLPGDLRLSLIGRRPDVVAARWRAEAAAHRVREARSAFYPDVNLNGYFGQQALHLDKLIASGAAFGAVGPAVTLPIFHGGALRGALRGAKADRDAAVAAYDAAVTEALREVADVAASYREHAVRDKESHAALAAYEGAYRVARLRYEGGLSTYQSVLLAEDAVLTQRRIVADIDSRYYTLDVALVRALGGGYGAPKEPPHA
jgi:NodT family efflux transporter outer membrane factor (OMF) lipoprotein